MSADAAGDGTGEIHTVGDVELADTGNEQATVRTVPHPEGARLTISAGGVTVGALLLPEGVDELQADLDAAAEAVDPEAVAEARAIVTDEYAD